jgi:hypothetical protein
MRGSFCPTPSLPPTSPLPLFLLPAVFTRSVVLNITRKNREWRFYEFVGLRLEDLPKVSAVVSDIRKILRQVGGLCTGCCLGEGLVKSGLWQSLATGPGWHKLPALVACPCHPASAACSPSHHHTNITPPPAHYSPPYNPSQQTQPPPAGLP